jgi:hypothetical protein
MHIAAAVGTPTVALFGPSGDQEWGPWQVRTAASWPATVHPCRPCGQDGCGGSKVSDCLTALAGQTGIQCSDGSAGAAQEFPCGIPDVKLALMRQRYTTLRRRRALRGARPGCAARGEAPEVTGDYPRTGRWRAKRDGFRQLLRCDPSYSRLLGGRAATRRQFCRSAVQRRLMARWRLSTWCRAHERIPGCHDLSRRRRGARHLARPCASASSSAPLQRLLTQRWSAVAPLRAGGGGGDVPNIRPCAP